MKLTRPAFALAVAVVALASACSSGDSSESSTSLGFESSTTVVLRGGDAGWGPLAVVAGGGDGDEALIEGIIDISPGCVVLLERGERVLLVWPDSLTAWDAANETISFATGQLGLVSLGAGDKVRMSGGGSSASEGGPGAAAFLASINWIAPPPLACVTDTRWFVIDVVS